MITCGDEIQSTPSRAKNKPQPKTNATFKVIAFEAANAETGMQMRGSETIANSIDDARDLTPTRFRKRANATSETC